MKQTVALLLVCYAILQGASASVLISGFGRGEFNVSLAFGASDVQNSDSYQMVGDDGGATLWGELPAVVDITGNASALRLVGTLANAFPPSNLQISLIDSQGNEAVYQASFSAFALNTAAVVEFLPVEMAASFNNLVGGIGFMTGGLGAPVDLTVDALMAVPEPSTAAFLGAGLLWVAIRRRRP